MAANLMMELGEIFREGWWLNFSSVRGARQWDGQIVGKQGAWHALSERRHRDRPSALTIRASVAGFRTTHSLILRTVHRSRRRHCATRLSRRLFVSILLRQNSVLVRGRYLQEQPCQKQPSTKTASFRPGHAKSGLPATGQCLRYPLMPAAQRSFASGSSVVVLPREWTAAMILDRTSFATWSTMHHLQFYRLA